MLLILLLANPRGQLPASHQRPLRWSGSKLRLLGLRLGGLDGPDSGGHAGTLQVSGSGTSGPHGMTL